MSQPFHRGTRIFLSYRREDAAGHAGRLYDRLCQHFGEEHIFMDIDTIEPGDDFVEVIQNAVSSCDVLLAVIGKQWLGSAGATERRIDNPEDFVRLEIAAALKQGVRLIPVLVHGANMPRPQELPEELEKLSQRNAFTVSDLRWRHDVESLIRNIEKLLPSRPQPPGPLSSASWLRFLPPIFGCAALLLWFETTLPAFLTFGSGDFSNKVWPGLVAGFGTFFATLIARWAARWTRVAIALPGITGVMLLLKPAIAPIIGGYGTTINPFFRYSYPSEVHLYYILPGAGLLILFFGLLISHSAKE